MGINDQHMAQKNTLWVVKRYHNIDQMITQTSYTIWIAPPIIIYHYNSHRDQAR